MRLVSTAMASFVMAVPAAASSISIELPGEVERIEMRYDCAGVPVEVEYINAGENSLAIVHLQEGPLVMANVLSASGARYAGRQYVWWTKGDEASLYDIRQGEEAEPVSCSAG